MMTANGFAYDDANNQWDTTGTAGQVLTANGAGGATWATAAAPAETPLTVVDSATVDLTASGISNHTVTAAVRLSAAAGQILTSDAAGLLVTCESVQDCVAPMMTANGFVYYDVNGQWDTTGTAGQFLAANGTGGATWTTASGTYAAQSITRTAATGGTVAGTTPQTFGSGQTLDFIAGEGIALTTAAGPSLTIAVRTSATSMTAAGFTCADTNGAPIFITATGLRTVPPHTSQALLRLTINQTGVGLAAGTIGTQATINRTITNPSVCRAASVHLNHVGRWRSGFQTSSGSNDMAAKGTMLISLGGGALAGPFTLAEWNPSYARGLTTPDVANRGGYNTSSSVTDSWTIAAGASVGVGMGVNINNDSTVGPLTAFNYVVGAESAGILVTQ
jgi:hypothetical protein